MSQRGFERSSFDPQVRQLVSLYVRYAPPGGPVRTLDATASHHRS